VLAVGANTKVRNGEISGMGFHGVRLLGDNNVADNLTLQNNGEVGIEILNGTVSNCNVSNNNFGITVDGAGLVLNNTVTNNRSEGITSFTTTGYLGNVLSGNNGGGPQVSGAINLGHNLCGTALCP
jgi:hypothetical protein